LPKGARNISLSETKESKNTMGKFQVLVEREASMATREFLLQFSSPFRHW